MQRQKGISLLEVIVALAIMSTVAVGTTAMSDYYASQAKLSATAQHMVTFGEATKSYVRDNFSTLKAASLVRPTEAIRLTPANLTSAGSYLPPNYSATTPFGHFLCALVVLNAAQDGLDTLVVAEDPADTSLPINDVDLGQLAGMIGGGGGAIYAKTPATVSGVMGGWNFPTANFTRTNNLGLSCGGAAGPVKLQPQHPVLALWLRAPDSYDGLLHRNYDASEPELNEMNTPLIMSARAVQSEGAACAAGAIARNAGGDVLACIGGIWAKAGNKYWGDAVNGVANLPTCNASLYGQTRVLKSPATGAEPRAYTCLGNAWQPLGMDTDGNLTVRNVLTVNNGAKITGNANVTGNVDASGFLRGGQVAEGTVCGLYGSVARSTQGGQVPLYCSGATGTWTTLKGDTGPAGGTGGTGSTGSSWSNNFYSTDNSCLRTRAKVDRFGNTDWYGISKDSVYLEQWRLTSFGSWSGWQYLRSLSVVDELATGRITATGVRGDLEADNHMQSEAVWVWDRNTLALQAGCYSFPFATGLKF